jgi:hypothetical protein
MWLRPMRASTAIGLLLLGLSTPPLLLMGREVIIGTAVRSQYDIESLPNSRDGQASALSGELGGHRVELTDDQPRTREPFKTEESQRAPGFVQVIVDGRPVFSPVAATIRLTHSDANRYWGFVYLLKLTERRGPERLVVAQNLGRNRYRTISVFADGRVVEDTFAYAERCSPPIRAAVIRYVVPHPSGFCSDLMQVWPTIWYPLLYPWLSGALGVVLLLLRLLRP